MISNEKLRTHFEAHFSEQPDSQMPEELENPEQQDYFEVGQAVGVDQSAPPQEEVEKALANLKNQKSSGIDKCPLESLNYGRGSARLIVWIRALISMVWTSVVVPSTWLRSQITCLHKKSSFVEPKNYRLISTMANLSRIIPMINQDRVRDAYSRL